MTRPTQSDAGARYLTGVNTQHNKESIVRPAYV